MLEGSLVAPVIASIHEKCDALRKEIKGAAEREREPRLPWVRQRV